MLEKKLKRISRDKKGVWRDEEGIVYPSPLCESQSRIVKSDIKENEVYSIVNAYAKKRVYEKKHMLCHTQFKKMRINFYLQNIVCSLSESIK